MGYDPNEYNDWEGQHVETKNESRMDRLELQRKEFDAANAFAKALQTHNHTPVVDDDYPEVKLQNGDKDWKTPCENCGQKPTVHPLKLCGPCCFGEAETAGGNW